eukprot:CAMPEP_0170542012 /NCGR_PEP_ID=MMETSP0211-20121228/1577_1 /TAXON_ID=311385 /ORGANISM="Pseudokeronopsis sp., Strain OXSARD2" /LENGTH=36 /DNA_ID= /DNA_START= /DNA_END= /DNA_ORIENTATION=
MVAIGIQVALIILRIIFYIKDTKEYEATFESEEGSI